MKKPNIARQPLGLVVATFLVVMILFSARSFLAPYEIELLAGPDMPLGHILDEIIPQGIIHYFIGFIMAFINAMLLSRIIIRYSISPIRTYIPIVMYSIFAYGIYIPANSLCVPAATTLLLLSSSEIIAAFRRSYQFGAVFKSGFFLGIIPLIFSPATILIIMLPVTLILYRRTLREIITGITGLILPFALCSSIWWLTGTHWSYISDALFEGLSNGYSLSHNFPVEGTAEGMYIILLVGIIILSIICTAIRFREMRSRVRKIHIHFLWLLAACTAVCLLFYDNISFLSFLAVPAAFISSAFLTRYKGWLTLSLYITMILIAVAINIFRLIG